MDLLYGHFLLERIKIGAKRMKLCDNCQLKTIHILGIIFAIGVVLLQFI